MFSSCNPKFFAVRHIHYPVNPSNDNDIIHSEPWIMHYVVQ